jgi:hypothetical protein
MAFSRAARVRMRDGLFGHGLAARIGRGDAGAPGQRHAQRFGQTGHGGRGAHHVAVAGAAVDAAFDLAQLFVIDAAGAVQVVELAPVGAGADFLIAPAPVQLRSASHHDGGQIGAGRAHDLRRRGFVAAAEEHHAIQRIGADGLLDVHRHQVAIQHGGGLHVDFAQRNGGELQRETAGGPHPALHRLGHGAQVEIAVVQLAPGIADPDDGPILKDLRRETFGADGGAVGQALVRGLREPALAAQFRAVGGHSGMVALRGGGHQLRQRSIDRSMADRWFVANRFRRERFERLKTHCTFWKPKPVFRGTRNSQK